MTYQICMRCLNIACSARVLLVAIYLRAVPFLLDSFVLDHKPHIELFMTKAMKIGQYDDSHGSLVSTLIHLGNIHLPGEFHNGSVCFQRMTVSDAEIIPPQWQTSRIAPRFLALCFQPTSVSGTFAVFLGAHVDPVVVLIIVVGTGYRPICA